MQFTKIAQVAHAANRAYCATIGDFSQQDWEKTPEWQKKSAIEGVRFHWDQLCSGREATASASHDSWLAEKEREGWKYGPIKNPEKKEHPCFVPYEELPLEQRIKDYIFGGIVKAIWDANEKEQESPNKRR